MQPHDQYSVLISDIVLSDPGVISIIETTFSADVAHHMFSFVWCINNKRTLVSSQNALWDTLCAHVLKSY